MTGVVIPYYQGTQFITKCVESIVTSAPDAKIYLVDNDPEPLAADPLVSSNCTILKAADAIGYGRAANLGTDRAIKDGCSALVVANQDTVFDPGCIRALATASANGGDYDIHVPMIHEYGTSDLEPHFVERVLNTTKYFSEQNSPSETYELSVAGAACIAFRPELFKDLGLFDPLFHMYGEDDDLFDRSRRVGGMLLLVPSAHIQHYHALVKASGTERRKIERFQLFARTVLTARSGIDKAAFVRRTPGNILHNLGRLYYAVRVHLRVLSHWELYKDITPEGVSRRTQNAIIQDSKPGSA